MQGHDDVVAGSRKSLIDGIVDDLPQAVHKTLRVGGADVHARTLAHRIQALKNS